jgi:hypothetical protein
MAQSGVRYTFGRESQAGYGESLAGVRAHRCISFWCASRPRRGGKLLAEWFGTAGRARLSRQKSGLQLSHDPLRDPANRGGVSQAAGLRRKRYELLARLLDAMTAWGGRR